MKNKKNTFGGFGDDFRSDITTNKSNAPTACPHCGHELTRSEIASLMRSFPSEIRSQTSRDNGRKGGGKMKCGDCGHCANCKRKAKRILRKQNAPT